MTLRRWEKIYQILTVYPKAVIRYIGRGSQGRRHYIVDTGETEPEVFDQRVIDSLLGQEVIEEIEPGTYRYKE